MTRSAVALLLAAAAAAPAAAQRPNAQGEVRLEFYASPAALAGAAAVIPAGTYARVGVGVSGGRYLEVNRSAARADALLRFHFDPLRQYARAVYAAGGLSVAYDADGVWRPYLMLRVGVEGRPRGRVIPALEAGLGGGAHIAVALRRARSGGR